MKPSLALVVTIALGLLACRPDLPSSTSHLAPADFAVQLEPAAPLDRAPPILRLHLTLEPPADLDRIVLVEGDLSASRLLELSRGDIPDSLRKRFLPVVAWPEGAQIVVSPEAPLERGRTYTIASGSPKGMAHVRVDEHDAVPIATRVWPPAGLGATLSFGVFCSDTELAPIDDDILLAPEREPGRLVRGLDADVGDRCARFDSLHAVDAGPLVPPPAIDASDASTPRLRLDPRPFQREAEARPIEPLTCTKAERPFGPGCVRVEDDRALVRSPSSPALWAIGGAGLDEVRATAAGDPFVLTGLPPATAITLSVAAFDNAGDATRASFETTTLPPMAHVILSEVLANPLGPEPRQEWVEIVNDGRVATSLASYSLADDGGSTPLPDVTLPAGAYALIVNHDFVLNDGVDVAAPASTLLVRVAKLGKSGLSNAGESLRLIDAEGRTISAVPPLHPPAGKSAQRVRIAAPDGLPSSFRVGPPTPGAPAP